MGDFKKMEQAYKASSKILKKRMEKERPMDLEILEKIKESSIIIVAEGETPGLCYDIKRKLADDYDVSSHLCILGHIQRGGKPTALDRFRASRMGYRAIKALMEGEIASVTAYLEGNVKLVPFTNCLENKKEYEKPYLELIKVLAI